jgi:indolepyruvate ferredoxin oxidoreductase
VDAGRLATALLGNSIGSNMFMLGYAYQLGALPLSADAIERAIEMNGEAVPMNISAFRYGRRAAVDPKAVEALIEPRPQEQNDSLRLSQSFAETVDRRAAFLTDYQNAAYARRYRNWVEKVRTVEAEKACGQCGLAEAVARYLFKLMAYKDEYEVARLHAAASYGEKPRFHLSPPLIAGIDPATGRRRKIALPGWLALPLFRVLRHGKHLRGTALDLFGRQNERRMERLLIDQYIGDLRAALAALRPDTLDVAVAVAQLPDMIRGFGPVKDANRLKAEEQRRVLLPRLAAAPLPVAAE